MGKIGSGYLRLYIYDSKQNKYIPNVKPQKPGGKKKVDSQENLNWKCSEFRSPSPSIAKGEPRCYKKHVVGVWGSEWWWHPCFFPSFCLQNSNQHAKVSGRGLRESSVEHLIVPVKYLEIQIFRGSLMRS